MAGLVRRSESYSGSVAEKSVSPGIQTAEAPAVLRRSSSATELLPAKLDDAKLKEPDTHHLDQSAHAVRDSLLHSGSGFEDFRGLYNLALLALIVSNLRMALENISKYGILVHPIQWVVPFFTDPHGVPVLAVWGIMGLCIFAALGIEKLAARKTCSATVALWLHVINSAILLIVPSAILLYYHPFLLASFIAIFENVIVWMKLVSYAHVNHWCRTKPRDNEEPPKDLVRYPQNLNSRDLLYFIAAPTLCYELNFPRVPKIRKRFLIRRCLEFVFFFILVVSLGQQWILPTVNNTFKSEHNSLVFMLERTLKLAMPNFCIWLLLFYMFFHAWLNITGELLRFGDRQFYRDWWNATSIFWFWRNWNIPVHKWAVRHVFRPLVSHGYTRLQSQIAVFLLSAIFHEVLVGVPLGIPRLWSFLAMLTQVPLAVVTERYLKGTQYGNVVMWASLLLGQPTAIMLYVKAYIDAHADDS
eukprot:m.205958 g.205958  ORF g.205958 m.205958 type:complete len:472 (+) comp15533_c1_seq1:2634-4049(+)